MTVTIRGLLDSDIGTELGVRLYKKSAPAVQVGSDQILARTATNTTLYSLAGLDVATFTVSTDYWARLYRTDGGGTLTTFLTATEIYIGADGGTFTLGDNDATESNQTAILSAIGSAALVQTNVLTGGKIILKQGDDHTKAMSNSITITQTDAGAAMYTRLVAADSLQFGFRYAGPDGAASDIAGTLAIGDVSESGGVTTIVGEVTAAAMVGKTLGDYCYDIQRTTGSAVATELTGPAVLQKDNAA